MTAGKLQRDHHEEEREHFKAFSSPSCPWLSHELDLTLSGFNFFTTLWLGLGIFDRMLPEPEIAKATL